MPTHCEPPVKPDVEFVEAFEAAAPVAVGFEAAEEDVPLACPSSPPP